VAEILLWVVDRGGEDQAAGYSDWKSGDVIAFRGDGYPWSPCERVYAAWRILRIGLTLAEAKALLETPRELNADGDTISKAYWRRARGLNISALPQARRNELLAPRTGDGVLVIPANRLAAYRTALIVKQPRQ
jgi:hypothetical protein